MSPTPQFAAWVQPEACAALTEDTANASDAAATTPEPLPTPQPLDLSADFTNTLANPPVTQPVPAPNRNLRMLGPADVLGVDPAQIIRRFPAPGSANVEATSLACIEFAGTDLPWRFSPITAAAPTGRRVRPWLALLVVSIDLPVTAVVGSPCPQINVPADQLPDLRQSWAWAHAQLDGDDPAVGRSRLLCPRRLTANTLMRAVLVPAFAGGVAAGLGATVPPNPNDPAWATGPMILPVYDHWTFTAGNSHDFEYYAERLRPIAARDIPDFGVRRVDVGDPLNRGSGSAVAAIGSALGPLSPSAPAAADVAARAACAATIATHRQQAVAANALAPPWRGVYHVGESANPQNWLTVANTDPRWRLAAARGADWVEANQDDLMAQSWEQAGQIRAAAARLALTRAAVRVNASLQRRHVTPLSLDETARLTAPAAARLRLPGAAFTTVADVLAASPAPTGMGSTAQARLVRARGLLRRAGTPATLISRAMSGDLLGAPGVTDVSMSSGRPSALTLQLATPAQRILTRMTVGAGPNVVSSAQIRAKTVISFHSTLTTVLKSSAAGVTAMSITAGGARRVAVDESLGSLGWGPNIMLLVDSDAGMAAWRATLTADVAMPKRVLSMLGGSSSTAAADGSLQPALPAPTVRAPLALALAERDPEWLISGIGVFPTDGATLLQPDQAFIEAVLLGANYALLDEYLWRDFPTDRRGTPIRNFWPVATPGQTDIAPITDWNASVPLGLHPPTANPTPGGGSLTVLLVRSELFEHYPDTIVAVIGATVQNGTPVPDPIVRKNLPAFPPVALDARTRVFGFAVDHAAMSTTPGCFFAFIEPPTGARFGFESWSFPTEFIDVTGKPWPTSGDLAKLIQLLPVRLFVHSSRMVAN